jgi:hypothetical protein
VLYAIRKKGEERLRQIAAYGNALQLIKPNQDQLLHIAKAPSIQYKAGLLTCNIFTALPIPQQRNSGHNILVKTFCVTYSCATVSDLHTIPY